jgi:aminoglycoside 6'-N-acetyltransferase
MSGAAWSSASIAKAMRSRDNWPTMSTTGYTFRLANAADLPMLRRWLQTPDVVRWWGEPAEQLALLTEDLSNSLMTMRIVSHADQPFAYAQDYDVRSWPQSHFVGLPAGTRAIDAFIGEPAFIGRGHGGRFLRLLAEQLRSAGAPLVAIDPDVENFRARRAYARAGFHGDTIVATGEGPAVLMIFDGS